MFLILDKKDRKKFILHKALIIFFTLLMLPLAAHFAKVEIPNIRTGLSLGIGWTLILIIGALAILNRLKVLFKVKSMTFLVAFIIFSLLKVSIDALVYSTGLVTIPLLIDDIIINPYWKVILYRKYKRLEGDSK